MCRFWGRASDCDWTPIFNKLKIFNFYFKIHSFKNWLLFTWTQRRVAVLKNRDFWLSDARTGRVIGENPLPVSFRFFSYAYWNKELNFAASSLVTFPRKTACPAALESHTRAWLLHTIYFFVTKLYRTNVYLKYFAHFVTLFCVCGPCGRFLGVLEEPTGSVFKVRECNSGKYCGGWEGTNVTPMWGSWENLWPVRAVGAGRRIEWEWFRSPCKGRQWIMCADGHILSFPANSASAWTRFWPRRKSTCLRKVRKLVTWHVNPEEDRQLINNRCESM